MNRREVEKTLHYRMNRACSLLIMVTGSEIFGERLKIYRSLLTGDIIAPFPIVTSNPLAVCRI
jgi:hypothetical protein